MSDRLPSSDTTIQVEGLVKNYGSLQAVAELNFNVKAGEIFGLIGPDGAGKTSTFQILAGVMEATKGHVNILGRSPQEAKKDVGYLTQGFSLYPDLSIEENLRYIAGLRHVSETEFRERSAFLLDLVGLTQFSHRLARQLSGGMKQKLTLCSALISQPQVLLLDEPTTGVDPVSRREFWDLLAEVASEGVTIVTATPYLDEAERCHRIGLIYQGKLQQIGTLRDLQESLGLHRLEVRVTSLPIAENILRDASKEKSSQLKDIQSFGDRLDILTPDVEEAKQEIVQSLTDNQITLQSLEVNQPTLENVFVNRLRQQGAAPIYRPFPYYRKQKPLSTSENELAISATNLTKQFGDFYAVKEVNLEVQYGEIYGLLGANGAGKTTMIKMLCGLLLATSGEMSLAGETENLHRAEIRAKLGYMSQKFTLYDDLTIQQNLEFYCGVYGIPRKLRQEKIDWVLATCGLIGQENRITKSLPGGWKQRVAFGASVMHEPDILFLDEPTSGVDPLARRQFWRLIRDFANQGTAILVTTHYLEEAENCHSLGLMVAGEIVTHGSPTHIKSQQPGQLIELSCNQLQKASHYLKKRIDSWRVAIFGDRLHLVLDHPDQELQPLLEGLEEQGIKVYGQRTIPFTLEDVFISTVEGDQER